MILVEIVGMLMLEVEDVEMEGDAEVVKAVLVLVEEERVRDETGATVTLVEEPLLDETKLEEEVNDELEEAVLLVTLETLS